ncbi:MAG: hypothetical protein A2V83_01415 [Nitrospirae bacterium RBG_16_64_22]|nr:MAG: hypothetical protein A2V83_01415 [Nitrospirae bacterium RBG_16_64_22]
MTRLLLSILLLPAAVLAGGTWWTDPDRIALGETVFDAKCMGCHHPEVKAFGPSFRWIASRRTPAEIYAYIVSPAALSRERGYASNSMPHIPLTREEIEAAAAYVYSFRSGRDGRGGDPDNGGAGK